jgi:hypothetical protein
MAKRTNLGSTEVASYHFENRKINVYGCWDEETEEGEFDFFDIYEEDEISQTCLNLGDPFWSLPTKEDVKTYLS